ncbi:hypothetical protein LX36DRAFT_159008 [Colletotrichum falcatum]|nr:hypothetical protein LX36DRAFT_159008 [Colletotrichum falcatum]
MSIHQAFHKLHSMMALSAIGAVYQSSQLTVYHAWLQAKDGLILFSSHRHARSVQGRAGWYGTPAFNNGRLFRKRCTQASVLGTFWIHSALPCVRFAAAALCYSATGSSIPHAMPPWAAIGRNRRCVRRRGKETSRRRF